MTDSGPTMRRKKTLTLSSRIRAPIGLEHPCERSPDECYVYTVIGGQCGASWCKANNTEERGPSLVSETSSLRKCVAVILQVSDCRQASPKVQSRTLYVVRKGFSCRFCHPEQFRALYDRLTTGIDILYL